MLARPLRPVACSFVRPSLCSVFSKCRLFATDSIHFSSANNATPASSPTFKELGIQSAPLLRALTSLQYKTPTIVQQQAIPRVLAGPDLVIAAETGCGKTLAYLLPLMELLLSGKTISGQKYPPVIVLCPSRELCTQTLNVFTQLCAAMGKTFLLPRVVVGTEKFPAPFHKITDVLITTPSTLEVNIDNCKTNDFFTQCHHLVLDECDSLLCDATSASTKRILQTFLRIYDQDEKNGNKRQKKKDRVEVDHSLQCIFVGATIPTYGKKSVDSYLRHHFPSLEWLTTSLFHRHKPNLKQTWIEAPCEAWEIAKLGAWRLALDANNATSSSPSSISSSDNQLQKEELEAEGPPVVGELITPVVAQRLSLLYEALGEDPKRRTIIFCSSALSCQQVAKYLAEKKRAYVVLHGRTPALHRQEALNKLAQKEVNILICTNAATRGLDVVVEHVIQYDFAENVVDHIHRIGRTGRVSRLKEGAAKEACVTNFYTAVNKALVKSIREQGDDSLVGAFSRKASFRRKLRKQVAAGQIGAEISDSDAQEDSDEFLEAREESSDSKSH